MEQVKEAGTGACVKCGAPVGGHAPLGMCRDCLRTSAGLGPAPPGTIGQSSPAELVELSISRCLDSGRFTLIEPLGAGGMGVVWLALDERLSREGEPAFAALKFLVSDIRENPQALDFLKREVLQSRRLNHPNILRIFDWHQHQGEPVFFSMEFVPGETLRQLLERRGGKPVTWVELHPLISQLCEALDYAHRVQSIVHRDLKPANVMVTPEGVLKLADFGLARPATHESQLDLRTTHARGTPHYMSPQQMHGAPPRPADDIYSLGVTLYELLTGATPFEDEIDIFAAIESLQPEGMGERLFRLGLRDEIPARVRNTVASCLEKDPARRPATVREVFNLLGLALQENARPMRVDAAKPRARPVVVSPQPIEDDPPPKRGWTEQAFLALLLLVLAGVGLSWWLSGSGSWKEYQQWVVAKIYPASPTPALETKPLPLPGGVGDSPGAQSNAAPVIPKSAVTTLDLVAEFTPAQKLEYLITDTSNRVQFARGSFAPDGTVEVALPASEGIYVVQAGHGYPPKGASWVNYEVKLGAGEQSKLVLDFRPGDFSLFTKNNNIVIERTDFWNNTTRFDLAYGRLGGWQTQAFLSEKTNLHGRISYKASIPGSYFLPRFYTGVADSGTNRQIDIAELTLSPSPLILKDWTNSLGMQLVWMNSSDFWAARTETTVLQYSNLLRAANLPFPTADSLILAVTTNGFAMNRGSWMNPGFPQTPNNPVVGVSWEDATNFCHFLTLRERAAGRLSPHQTYSLPTDAQWTSLARGMSSPVYPWGDTFPPDPRFDGAYACLQTMNTNWPAFWGYLNSQGNAARTSPVQSCRANANGLFDVGGNAAEWCLDYYRAAANSEAALQADPAYFSDDGGGAKYRVVRGGSWFDDQSVDMQTMTRNRALPNERNDRTGFRIVLLDDSALAGISNPPP
jgi:serine/threonine protein kinase/formylglycine-generating enzyme required for sulfatase activity